jgi:ferredoxin
MGYVIDHACGGNARCGTCCVRVVEGGNNLSPAGPDEAAMLRELGLAAPHRLSCQARVYGDVVVVAAG